MTKEPTIKGEQVPIMTLTRRELEEDWYTLHTKLQAKEQECEKLKKKLKPKLKNAHCTYFEGQTGLCKAKEFTRCNPVGCKLYTIDELSTIVDLQKQLDQLKAEKEVIRNYLGCVDNQTILERLDQLQAENDELKEAFNNAIELSKIYKKQIFKSSEKALKYSQALQEIKGIAGDDCKTCTVKLLGEDEINCKRCYKTKILQKCEVIDAR